MSWPALPPFAPRLLAFDLDGTLIQDGGTSVPDATATALRRLQGLGVRVALVTGRDSPPRGVREAISFDAQATNNGGRVQVGEEVHRDAQFTAADLRAVLAHELADARTVLFDAQGIYVDLPAGREPEAWMVARSFRPISEAPQEGIVKVGFYHPDVAGHAERLRQSHPHLVVTGGQEPYTQFLTVTPQGANKAAALTLLAEGLDVPLEQTMAFGDSDNDEVMLELAAFAVQVGTLPLLEPHADTQLPDYTHVGAYLNALADQLDQR
ncbi:HAD-IIB family hydrolase [Deinococcus fonticola]|uniref:HAD-IIB family hydrolase n=1 Tax=Deinococcus fonticola TaxID=2528713 RepID=UPI0010750C83|nr:HAD family hydrolase [Deinococcus fonticola]